MRNCLKKVKYSVFKTSKSDIYKLKALFMEYISYYVTVKHSLRHRMKP